MDANTINGRYIGTQEGKTIYSVVDSLGGKSVYEYLEWYYLTKMSAIRNGEPIQTYPFNTHASARTDFKKLLQERIPVQLKFMEQNQPHASIVFIPKLYKINKKMTDDDEKRLEEIRCDVNTGITFIPHAVSSTESNIYMYVGVLIKD